MGSGAPLAAPEIDMRIGVWLVGLWVVAGCSEWALGRGGPPKCEQLCMRWHLYPSEVVLSGALGPRVESDRACVCVPVPAVARRWDAGRDAHE